MTTADISPFEDPVSDFAEQLDFSSLEDFTAANGPSNATISPQELFLDHDFTTPSTGTTNYLTTPSLCDGTPDLDSYDCSPAFSTMDTDQIWPPLFSDIQKDDYASQPLFASTEDLGFSQLSSLASSTSSLPEVAVTAPRKASAPAASPSTDILHQLSTPAGVIKSSRRACRDLTPIVVDEEDERAVKRARNTMAARKSRQKKRDVEDSLRIALEAMTTERDRWRMLAVKYGAPIPDE